MDRAPIDVRTGLRLNPHMRLAILIVVTGAIFIGCQNVAPSKPAKPPRETVVPISPIRGKVVLLNAGLKYVIVDFSLGRLPNEDQQLNVYRAGQKVGELRVSGQGRSVNLAADIVAGDAQVGDEVKPD